MPATVPRNPSSGATLETVARTISPRSRKPSSTVPVVLIACCTSLVLRSRWRIRVRPLSRIAATGPGVSSQSWIAASSFPARTSCSTSDWSPSDLRPAAHSM